MVLYGRYLSPFVRRVALWMRHQGRSFEHRPLQVAGEEFDRLRQVNPVGRVPTLQLPGGEVLIETDVIVDVLESLPVGDSGDACPLLPQERSERLRVLPSVGMANGLAEKAVALVYERQRRPERYHWPEWQARLEGQISGALDSLEDMAVSNENAMSCMGVQAAVVSAFDFAQLMHPQLIRHPRLQALSAERNQQAMYAETHPKRVTG